MYQNKKSKRFRFKKSAVLAVSVLLLLAAVIGTTIAFLITKTDSVTNKFEYGKVSCYVDETFDGSKKEYVKIENTGNIPAYIRAKVIITWKDEDGNVYGGSTPVEGEDYTIVYNLNPESGWEENDDGYYYFNTPVDPNEKTDFLISSCKKKEGVSVPDGYDLSVEIIADAIQSEPKNAVNEAWSYYPSSN